MTSEQSVAENFLIEFDNASRRFRSMLLNDFSQCGLTTNEARVLMIVGSHRGAKDLSMSEIADRMPLDTSHSKLIKDLRKANLLESNRDEHDERRWRVTLSSKGAAKYKEVMSVHKKRAAQIASNLNEAELESSLNVVRSIGVT